MNVINGPFKKKVFFAFTFEVNLNYYDFLKLLYYHNIQKWAFRRGFQQHNYTKKYDFKLSAKTLVLMCDGEKGRRHAHAHMPVGHFLYCFWTSWSSKGCVLSFYLAYMKHEKQIWHKVQKKIKKSLPTGKNTPSQQEKKTSFEMGA